MYITVIRTLKEWWIIEIDSVMYFKFSKMVLYYFNKHVILIFFAFTYMQKTPKLNKT